MDEFLRRFWCEGRSKATRLSRTTSQKIPKIHPFEASSVLVVKAKLTLDNIDDKDENIIVYNFLIDNKSPYTARFFVDDINENNCVGLMTSTDSYPVKPEDQSMLSLYLEKKTTQETSADKVIFNLEYSILDRNNRAVSFGDDFITLW